MVEPPIAAALPIAVARAPRLRHRWITAPSGVVILVCLVLPGLRVCGTPTRPCDGFGAQTPYLLGGLVAALARARPGRSVRAVVWAIRGLVWATVAGWAVALAAADALAFGVWTVIGAGLVLAFGWAAPTGGPAHALRVATATAWTCLAWFTILASTGDAMYGSYLGLGASLGLLVGTWWWRAEADAA